MSGRRIPSFVLPALIFVALVASPRAAQAVEEIARMETREVTCADGGDFCKQYLHQLTLTNLNQTRAGRTFFVYTTDEIDERLKGLRAAVLDPALAALAGEIERLKRSLVEVGAVCSEAPRPVAHTTR